AGGAPSIAFPLNSQVPPVARVSEAFRFTFSPTSFVSETADTSYCLSSAPPWLHIDGPSRSLSGIPGPSDVGPSEIVLTARDESGSTDMNATLIVSAESAPKLSGQVSEQLQAFGSLSSPSSILFYPSTAFDFSFSPETFTESGARLYYYAVSSDNTPLPSWVHFDAQDLRYSGTTPPLASLIEPPQTFGIKLICSDVAGFSAAAADFKIVVGSHQLAFRSPVQAFSVTKGVPFEIEALTDALTLDNVPVRADDIVSVDASPPSWLQLDEPSLRLSGIPPEDMSFENITITVKDVYNNVASVTLLLRTERSLFASQFSDIDTKPGHHLLYAVPPAALKDLNVDASSETVPSAAWLRFDESRIEWSGTVPTHAPSEIQVRLTLTSQATNSSESQTFKVRIADDSPTLNTRSPGDAEVLPTAEGRVKESDEIDRRTIILCAVLVPVGVVLFGAAITLCCWRRRRKGTSGRRYDRRPKLDISMPLEQLWGDSPMTEHSKEYHEDPPPRLPWPARLSGIWKSYPDIQQAQDDAGGHEVDDDDDDAVKLGSMADDGDRSRIGLGVVGPPYGGMLDLSPPDKAPVRPRRPDSSPQKSRARAKRLSKNLVQAAGSIREESDHQPLKSRDDDVFDLPGPSGPRLIGKDASRHTWTTYEDSQGSSDMLAVFPELAEKQQAPSVPPLSVRIVPKSESGSVLAERTKRYGDSPYFGCSSRVPSRPQTWRRQKGKSSPPASASEYTIDGMLRDLSSSGPHSGARASPSRAELYPRVLSINGKPVSRTFGSRISGNLNRLSRPLSRPLSSVGFGFRSPSMQSRDSIYSGDYMQLQDENAHRQWYQGGPRSPGPFFESAMDLDLPEHGFDGHGGGVSHGAGIGASAFTLDLPDTEQQDVEYGVASMMAQRPSTPGSMMAWPAALRSSSSAATPRLVEFRRKRPVSMIGGGGGGGRDSSRDSSGRDGNGGDGNGGGDDGDRSTTFVVNNSRSASIVMSLGRSRSRSRSQTGTSPLQQHQHGQGQQWQYAQGPHGQGQYQQGLQGLQQHGQYQQVQGQGQGQGQQHPDDKVFL
ncbi:MAG: hypothetical protein M1815_004004, partial [Lichina confinis]